MAYELVPKQFGIVKDLLPGAERFGLLINPTSTVAEPLSANLREASAAIERQIEVASARNIREIDTAFGRPCAKKGRGGHHQPNPIVPNPSGANPHPCGTPRAAHTI
jgi:hypothetical protein